MTDPTPEPPDLPGIDGATLLAEDPFACVYRATQVAFARPVVVKVITTTLDAAGRERFLAECREAGALSEHPAIVSLHDAGIADDGRPYLVMDHLPDGSLHDRLARQGPVGWQEGVRIGMHVAHALAAAHRVGVIHGSLGPHSVLLAPDGTPLLAEFRTARVVGDEAARKARTPRSVVGTAPEVLDGAEPSVAADVYGVGALLHELMVGTPPYAVSSSDSVPSAIRRVTTEAPASLAGGDVPDDVAEVVAGALARNPADRPESASALGRALHDLCRAHQLDLTDGRRWPEVAPAPPSPKVAASDQAPVATPYAATHRVPWTGMPAWSAADPGPEPVAHLDPDLDTEVLEWSGDWARVRCSNGWEAWVDGRQLVPIWA